MRFLPRSPSTDPLKDSAHLPTGTCVPGKPPRWNMQFSDRNHFPGSPPDLTLSGKNRPMEAGRDYRYLRTLMRVGKRRHTAQSHHHRLHFAAPDAQFSRTMPEVSSFTFSINLRDSSMFRRRPSPRDSAPSQPMHDCVVVVHFHITEIPYFFSVPMTLSVRYSCTHGSVIFQNRREEVSSTAAVPGGADALSDSRRRTRSPHCRFQTRCPGSSRRCEWPPRFFPVLPETVPAKYDNLPWRYPMGFPPA